MNFLFDKKFKIHDTTNHCRLYKTEKVKGLISKSKDCELSFSAGRNGIKFLHSTM
jgi:hypothetical protein